MYWGHSHVIVNAGYWAFGNGVNSNILVSLEHPRGVVATASLMVTVHMLGAYQLYRCERRCPQKMLNTYIGFLHICCQWQHCAAEPRPFLTALQLRRSGGELDQ